VALSRDALIASARATEDLLSGPGRWHLCLPHNHIAGLQVVLRALLAGAPPTVATPVPRFDPAVFADDLGRTLAAAGGAPVYTSLVPTQLVRILEVPRAARTLARTAAVLLGGSAISPRLLERSADAGVPVVRTYGMSETAGGCVYDGVPFPQVGVRFTADDRIVLSGPVLADGYVRVDEDPTAASGAVRVTALAHPDRAPDPAATEDAAPAGGFHGTGADRLLVTSDLGRWEADGRLSVLGRSDDIIVTGGENVSPHEVEALLLPLAEPLGFAEVLVTSRPHPEWGQQVVVLLVPAAGAPQSDAVTEGPEDGGPPPPARVAAAGSAEALAALRQGLRARGIRGPRVPQAARIVPRLPVRSIGKPDRAAAARLAPDAVTAGAEAGVGTGVDTDADREV
jgi:O-succinylbenzoic acid--CoA ligase